MSELNFIPVRGTEANILKQTPIDGYLYIATDTGKMWMGKKDNLNNLVFAPLG